MQSDWILKQVVGSVYKVPLCFKELIDQDLKQKGNFF
jgi:hypothetical protein